MKETMNLVFPATPPGISGFSEHLVEKFEMTPPMPWELATAIGPQLNHAPPGPRHGLGVDEIVAGHRSEYADTEFGRVEGYLMDQDFQAMAAV